MSAPATRIRNFSVTALLGMVAVATTTIARAADPLPSWNHGSARQSIITFVERVTKESSPDFVPVADRIAVFDNDGTLWSEQPMYVQLAFVLDRVRQLAPQHPEWKEKEPFKSVLAGDLKAIAAAGETGLMELLAATHGGMTAEQFDKIVIDWIAAARHPKYARPYTQCVYRPMVELIAFLKANGFKVYIVSGGGVEFMRPWTAAVYGVPPEQVIGSSIKTRYEVGADGRPVIVRLPEIDFIDDKAGKPVAIHKVIGKRPIAAFGNSDGDFEMLEYVTSGPGLRLGVLVHHDDAEREVAYDRKSHIGRLERGLDEAARRSWTLISMKADWKSVFPSPTPDQ
ncbi:HAD family hydrolase [Humisphaera borealis]|uniref:Haloacid dehalogenase-like hydrolase n=1 Tax=Humisphaera borealis TaxID=2807512 RepID=A0A7M2WVP8_9BACT|nr:HAD family hydrolase [Humisphaera borealis]QOV89302.1 haloacid dehalogenase-like hydrolase [Humisphaera borealis]